MPGARKGLVHSLAASLLMLASTASAQQSAPAAATDGATEPGATENASMGGDTSVASQGSGQPSDLTLLNFFTQGWGEAWVHRHHFSPDMSLLRVTTNFLEREFRIDYVFTAANNNPKLEDTQLLQGLIAYGVDRRIMLEVITQYQWNVSATGAPPENGPGGAALVRFQLVDTETASYAFQYRIGGPNRSIGQTTTSMQYALAGWQDIGALVHALGRFGLYYSFQYENDLGPHKATATLNTLTYVLSFAETWTPMATPVLGDFTTFVEFAGVTALDGSAAGTTISVTPGIRFWFLPKNSVTFGIDFPLTTNPSYSVVYRLNYILNF